MRMLRAVTAAVFMVACMGIFGVSQAEQANQQDSTMKKSLTPEEEASLKFIAVANEFRMLAAGDTNGAVKSLAGPGFLATWNKEFTPYFKDQEMQWNDFFSSALVFGGRFQGNRAVAIFYNPWSDVVFLAGLDLEAKTLLDGFLLCGETLRGEPVDEEAVIPAWQREASSLPVALAKVCTRTEQTINSLYPLEASYEVIPQPLKGRTGAQRKELLPAKVRMTQRMDMFVAMLSTDEGTPIRDMVIFVGKLTKAIKEGDKAAFAALLSPSQDAKITDDIFNLPDEVRGRMAPNFLLVKPEGGVAALVNPVVPQWFVPIYLAKGSDGKMTVRSVELFKFSLLNLLLK